MCVFLFKFGRPATSSLIPPHKLFDVTNIRFVMLRFSAIKWFVLSLILLAGSANASPTQYYAQIYTEVLGRSPEPADWAANEYRFTESSLSVSSARSLITSLLQTSEFRNLHYTPSETAYVLYRAILLREPSTAEMNNIANRISSGVSASNVAQDMMGSTEYSNLINNRIRKAQAHAYLLSNPSPRPTVGATGLGNTALQINGAELQAQLDAAAPGSTVFLARGVLVRAFAPITIPSGVTLTTYDSSSADHIYRNRKAYSGMGRIARTAMFNEPLVKVMPGAKIIGVWVDGRRSQLRVNDPVLKNPALSAAERFQFSHNISVLGGATGDQISEVSHCKVSDSTGWTSIHSLGHDGGTAIGVCQFANNMITSYSANRDLEESFFTDGISSGASHAVIINNDIVDPSDVGIVLFNPGIFSPQASQVAGNSILFAGMDGWGGITLDHSVGINNLCNGVNPAAPYNCFDAGEPAVTTDFTGTMVRENQIWSSDDHFANVGISLGVQLWGLRMFGTGATVQMNQVGTESQPLRTGVGIVVSGIKQPVVLDNTLNLTLDQSLVSCYSTPLLLDPTKTTLEQPDAEIQPNFVTGETWGMLRPKSNGYIFGNYNLISSSEIQRGVTVEVATSTLRLQDLNTNHLTEDWVIIHSERNFGDGQLYYLIKNRGTHQMIESGDGTISVGPFTGGENQYWRLEPSDGSTPGNGLRLVNRATGLYLARDAAGQVFATTDPGSLNVSWKFRKIESRPLDLTQPELLFMDPMGEIFQIYTASGHISEDRSVGNPSADYGIGLFAADNATAKPLGLFDLNGDNRKDAAFLLHDGRMFVFYQSSNGFVSAKDLGNAKGRGVSLLSLGSQSWEKPVGFVNVGGNQTEDIVFIDADGSFEAIYINPEGLAENVNLEENATDIGLAGMSSAVDSPYKPVGSGDFDGDGDRELLFVGQAGGLFRVDAGNGHLSPAVAIGNPVASFGWGFTTDQDSFFKPVAITDVNGDGVDDVVMVEGSGYLYAYIMRNGVPTGGANLGSPQRSWNWNLNTYSTYSRPIGIPYNTGWWRW